MGPAPMTTSFLPDRSECERDIGKLRIVECALERLTQWSGRHVEYLRPADHFELFRGNQRLQLRGGKGRVAGEQGIEGQQQPKQRIWDAHDRRAGTRHTPNLLDEIDVV